MAVDFTVATDVLAGLVAKVGKVVERRNTIPILSNVVVRANGDGSLSVEGTDLDLLMRAETPETVAVVRQPGATTVPQTLLADILRKAPKGEISFRADDNAATLKAGRSSFRLLALPVEDFPDISGVSDGKATTFALPPARLRRILSDTGFAISNEETRYYLGGIHFHAEDGRLVTVATDGHRLSRLTQDAIGDFSGMPGVIVPKKAARLFKDLAEWTPDGEDIRIRVDENKIELSAGTFCLVSKLIDGTFPDYNRVIPTNNPHRLDIDPEALRNATDRVSTVSNERGRAVKLTIAGNTVTLEVRSPDNGTATDEIAAEPAEPFELEIGFNAAYLVELLTTFESNEVAIALGDPGTPTIFLNPADEDRLVVLMPMRV